MFVVHDQDVKAELAQNAQALVQLQQSLGDEKQEHQTTQVALATECAAHQATQTTLTAANQELAQLRTAVKTLQLQQNVQGLVAKGHGLLLDDICVLAQFWELDIKPDVLRASQLTLQNILQGTSVSLKRKLSCTYGTAVALMSFLRKLALEAVLPPPRTGCTDLLDTALHRAHCPALKPLLVAQGVADDVLFDVELIALGAFHDEIAEHVDALKEVLQGFVFSISLIDCFWVYSLEVRRM
eukprot:m.289877 g.289877  ORF g.289877 m.289877 type:complete len:241 (+) comp55064_c0_seq20:93-815(+)